MKRGTLILCHGWAFTPLFWDDFLPFISKDWEIIWWDLGYRDGTVSMPLPKVLEAPIVGIGHSLGFAKLVLSRIFFTQLIGMNAFARLDIPLQKVEQMEVALNHNSLRLLTQFYRQCGPAKGQIQWPLSTDGLERLKEDLALLKTIDCRQELAQNQSFVSVMLNDQDPIVPSIPTKLQFESLGGHAKVHTMIAPHHGVGMDQWMVLRDYLNVIE